MQTLSNCHLAAFCTVHSNSKKQPNDNLIILACVIALVYFSSYIDSYSMGKLYPLGRNSVSVLVLTSYFYMLIMTICLVPT